MEPILKVDNLSVELDGETLIHDISFELGAGESMAVIGPNGAGKTLLLKSVLGILPHKGSVAWASGVRAGYVPQKVDLDRHISLDSFDIFKAKCRLQKISVAQIAEMMQKIGVTDEMARIPLGHLSGGQLQKMLIVLALLGKPALLLLDEPTANLDEPSETYVYELLHRLTDERIAVILVSHEIEVATHYAEKILCINKRGLCYGPPDEALTPEVLEGLYGSPRMRYHHMDEKEIKRT